MYYIVMTVTLFSYASVISLYWNIVLLVQYSYPDLLLLGHLGYVHKNACPMSDHYFKLIITLTTSTQVPLQVIILFLIPRLHACDNFQVSPSSVILFAYCMCEVMHKYVVHSKRVWFADIGGYDADLPLAHIVLGTRNNLE